MDSLQEEINQEVEHEIIPFYKSLTDIQASWSKRVLIFKQKRNDRMLEIMNEFLENHAALIETPKLTIPTNVTTTTVWQSPRTIKWSTRWKRILPQAQQQYLIIFKNMTILILNPN